MYMIRHLKYIQSFILISYIYWSNSVGTLSHLNIHYTNKAGHDEKTKDTYKTMNSWIKCFQYGWQFSIYEDKWYLPLNKRAEHMSIFYFVLCQQVFDEE